MPIRYRIGNIGTSSTDNCKLHLITHFILCLMCRADNSVCVLNNTISVEEVHCQLPAVYKLPEFPGVVASNYMTNHNLRQISEDRSSIPCMRTWQNWLCKLLYNRCFLPAQLMHTCRVHAIAIMCLSPSAELLVYIVVGHLPNRNWKPHYFCKTDTKPPVSCAVLAKTTICCTDN